MKFKCVICGETTPIQSWIESHLKVQHGITKDFQQYYDCIEGHAVIKKEEKHMMKQEKTSQEPTSKKLPKGMKLGKVKEYWVCENCDLIFKFETECPICGKSSRLKRLQPIIPKGES